MSLSHSKVFLFRSCNLLLWSIQILTKQTVFGGHICEPLHEYRNQRVFMYPVSSYTAGEVSYMLSVSVHITLTLLQFQ